VSTDQPMASGTLGAVSTAEQYPPASTAAAATAPRRGYGALWRGVPRELGFLLLTMPIAIAGMSVGLTMFWAGVGTIVIYVGLFVLIATFYVVRAFGTLEITRLRWAGRPSITEPQWTDPNRPTTFWRTMFGPFVNGHYWLYLLHTLIINPIVSIVSWTLTIAWTSLALGGLTGWFWERFIPSGDKEFYLSRVIVDWTFGIHSTFDPRAGDAIFNLILGIIFAVTLPFVTRGLTSLHSVIAHGMLGAWRSEPCSARSPTSPPPVAQPSSPRTRRSAASNATCTTARSSVSSGCRWISRRPSANSPTIRMRHVPSSRRPASRRTRPWRSCARCLAVSPRPSCKTGD
jgi:hypothetical protein